MNAELLKDNLSYTLDLEDSVGVTAQLDAFVAAFEQLTNTPTDPNLQSAFKTALTALREVMYALEKDLTNIDRGRLQSVKALDWMSIAFAEKLQRLIGENNMTPTVALSEIKATVESRRKFFNTLRSTNQGLRTIGIRGYGLTPGEPELSVLLPRQLFDNQLSGLIKELRQVSFIIRTIAAAVSDDSEEPEIRSISTTDPMFFLSTSVQVAIGVAATITWGLNTLIKMEELKQARAATKATEAFSIDELAKVFEPKFQAILSTAIKELKEEFLGKPNSGKHRSLGSTLENAAGALLSRLERGMKIEVLFLPKKEPVGSGGDSGEAEMKIPESHQKLVELAKEISYESQQSQPVLSIKYIDETNGENGESNAPKPKTDGASDEKEKGESKKSE